MLNFLSAPTGVFRIGGSDRKWIACGRQVGYKGRVFGEKKGLSMKSGIHPEYKEATITCACGSIVKVNSVRAEMHVNACSVCHPFFTGRNALVDAKGRVEQFRKRYAKK